jgi:hypothetical protein
MWLMWSLVSVRSVTVLVPKQDSCTGLHQMFHRVRNHFGCTRWYSKLTRLKRKLVLVCLEIVLILTQDRCLVCAKHTIGSKIILNALDGTPR